MPIYEFRCEACGERFEALVDVGRKSVECRLCGAPEGMRVLSAQAAPLAHVRSPAGTRAQERRNAQLRDRSKADLAAKRRRLRERPKGGPG